MNHKWIVTLSTSYEVEAPSAEEALTKFERESNFPQTKQVKFCEDWWGEEKKNELQKIISEALIKKVGSAKGYDEYAKFWKKYKKILNSVSSWKTRDMLAKYLHGEIHPENSNEDVVSVMIMIFDPELSQTLKTQVEDRVFYLDIPKNDAFKVLTLGTPF